MKIVFFVLIFILYLISGQQNDDIDPKTGCNKKYPHFSIGNINLTKENYEDFKAKNSVFLLGISNSSCTDCCFMEPILNLLQNLLSTRFKFRGKSIPIARIDIKKMKEDNFAKDIPHDNIFPRIFLYRYFYI